MGYSPPAQQGTGHYTEIAGTSPATHGEDKRAFVSAMRIVVHGQQAFGKAALEALLKRGDNVVAV